MLKHRPSRTLWGPIGCHDLRSGPCSPVHAFFFLLTSVSLVSFLGCSPAWCRGSAPSRSRPHGHEAQTQPDAEPGHSGTAVFPVEDSTASGVGLRAAPAQQNEEDAVISAIGSECLPEHLQWGTLRARCLRRHTLHLQAGPGTRTEEAGTHPAGRGGGTKGVGKEAVPSAGRGLPEALGLRASSRSAGQGRCSEDRAGRRTRIGPVAP